MMNKIISIITLLVLLLGSSFSATRAQEEDTQTELIPDEIVCELNVIVQRDDWLSKLSEKFYGDVLAFPAIAEATNAKATQDDSYAVIDDVDFIEIGWKLCIVDVATAEEILGFELESAPLSDEAPENLEGVISIGAAHALSGSFAATGQSIRNGIDLAVQEINSSIFLGGATLQVIWEDTAGDKQQAVDAFNKLINQDQAVAIFGPTLSRSAFAAVPLAQAAGVPVIGSSNAARGITDMGNYVFRTNLPESDIIANTIQRTQDLFDLQQVVIIYDGSNAFTKVGYDAFVQALNEEEIEIVATVALNGEDIDLSARLTEFQTLNPQAIILSVLPEDGANIILQARQLGISEDARFIGDSSLNASTFFTVGGEAVEGTIIGSAWSANTISGGNRKFVADYEAEYGRLPDQFAAQSYTAVWALATALRNADSTERVAVRNTLDDLALTDTPLGLFTFNDNRNPDHAPVVQVAENSTFVILQQ